MLLKRTNPFVNKNNTYYFNGEKVDPIVFFTLSELTEQQSCLVEVYNTHPFYYKEDDLQTLLNTALLVYSTKVLSPLQSFTNNDDAHLFNLLTDWDYSKGEYIDNPYSVLDDYSINHPLSKGDRIINEVSSLKDIRREIRALGDKVVDWQALPHILK